MDRTKRIATGFRSPSRFCLCILWFLLVVLYVRLLKQDSQPMDKISIMSGLSSVVNLVDLNQISTNKMTCIKTKELFNLYSTTICLHNSTDHVSETIYKLHIWEEDYVTRLLRILIRNPHLDMIDIGANIGSYTMFTAGALGRFTLAVECYTPNIERIVRAVQITKVQNRVVLVHNALYSKSGEDLELTNSYPSGRSLVDTPKMNSTSEFVVKTIRFDDLLPILMAKEVRSAMIKIDIEGAERFLCETGSKIFSQIDIQFVMMEWGHGLRKTYEKQYQWIVDCFANYDYVTTDEKCTLLNTTDWRTTWPGNIYWIKRNNFRKNIC